MQKNKSITALIFLTVSLFVLLAACGGEEPEATSQPTPEPAAATPVADASFAEETEPAPTTVPEEEILNTATAVDEGEGAATEENFGLMAVIVSGDSAGTGKPFTFDATQSEVGELTIEGHLWDMGDGTVLHGLSVEHAYSEPGLYTVTLTVSAVGGQTDTTSKVVEVIDLVEGATPTAESALNVDGTSWEMDNAMRGTTVTLLFDEDTAAGSSGCNTYSASYTFTAVDDSSASISVSSITTSSQTCTPEVMAQEQGYLESLDSARTITISESTLTLETGSGTLTFSQIEAVG
jgi:heat shock protein HslJ